MTANDTRKVIAIKFFYIWPESNANPTNIETINSYLISSVILRAFQIEFQDIVVGIGKRFVWISEGFADVFICVTSEFVMIARWVSNRNCVSFNR